MQLQSEQDRKTAPAARVSPLCVSRETLDAMHGTPDERATEAAALSAAADHDTKEIGDFLRQMGFIGTL